MMVFKLRVVYLARDIPAFVMYCINGSMVRQWSISLIPTCRVYRLYDVCSQTLKIVVSYNNYHRVGIIESVDSISRDERDAP